MVLLGRNNYAAVVKIYNIVTETVASAAAGQWQKIQQIYFYGFSSFSYYEPVFV